MNTRKTVKIWDSKAFHQGKLAEKEVTYGYCTPNFNDRAIHEPRAPITYKLQIEYIDPIYRYGFRWVFSYPPEPLPLIEPLRLARDPKLKTRADHGLTEKRLFCYVHKGRDKIRYATQTNTRAPNIETYPFAENLVYKFYYRCSFTKHRTIKTVKSNKNRIRKTPRVKYTDNLLQTQTEYMILEKLTVTDQTGITLILFKLEYADKSDQVVTTEQIRATRTHHKKLKVINYTKLMKYEKRISKKWFKTLLNVLQTEKPNLSTLPTHLKKIAKKVITYTDINPTLKTTNTKKTDVSKVNKRIKLENRQINRALKLKALNYHRGKLAYT